MFQQQISSKLGHYLRHPLQLTVQLGHTVIYDTLLSVGILNGRVIVCHKVALNTIKILLTFEVLFCLEECSKKHVEIFCCV